MKALIIGGGGFVGSYLARQLVQGCHWDTTVTKLPQEDVSVEGCEAYNLDILDQDAVEALLVRLRPDVIFHLAAQSSVAFSWKNPQKTVEINLCGSLNVLDAVRAHRGLCAPHSAHRFGGGVRNAPAGNGAGR
ncbi:MAG: GDP-mannose 4,6-dehydratase [Ruminococcus sp.]